MRQGRQGENRADGAESRTEAKERGADKCNEEGRNQYLMAGPGRLKRADTRPVCQCAPASSVRIRRALQRQVQALPAS